MPRGYIFNQTGQLEEEIEYSVDGGDEFWCPACRKVTHQALVGISSTRGPIYVCTECDSETS
jgi:hypothetical protein